MLLITDIPTGLELGRQEQSVKLGDKRQISWILSQAQSLDLQRSASQLPKSRKKGKILASCDTCIVLSGEMQILRMQDFDSLILNFSWIFSRMPLPYL